ncbi:hypothetical protein MKX01_021316 [Papaver californicum]|nr:hypothetical protein MKX01_021316 [Papaver californicum]
MKWSKGKQKEKVNNMVLFDQASYDKLISEAPKCKLITPSVLSDRLRIQGCQEEGEMVEFSGPLLSQAHRVDELLEKRDRRIRRAVQKSWFQRGKKE